jgi:Holliday junction resolvase RusA-like endonuclease
LTVLGEPIGQGSVSGFINPHTKRVVIQEAKKGEPRRRWKSWREAVRSEAQDAVDGDDVYPLDCPVVVRISFGLSKPKSYPKTKRTWPIKKRSGDIDKLERAVLDSLTGVVFVDDAQVVELWARKDWSPTPGAVIDIEEVLDGVLDYRAVGRTSGEVDAQ